MGRLETLARFGWAAGCVVVLLLLATVGRTARSAEDGGQVPGGTLLRALSGVAKAIIGQQDGSPPGDVDAVPKDATHEQVAIIKVSQEGEGKVPLHTFCLDGDGNILAGCGSSSGQIRIIDPEGNLLKTWSVDVRPEAVGVAPDGAVYVAGSGRLLTLDPQGNVVLEKDAPHAAALRNSTDVVRTEVIEQAQRMAKMFDQQIEMFEKQIARIEEKEDDKRTPADKSRLKSFRRTLKNYRDMKERQGAKAELSEEDIDKRVQSLIERKTRVSSISVTEDAVYVACMMVKGYGFQVWRMDRQFGDPQQIVDNLRGCCGQMDVKARGSEVFVAENARHRVCRYDRDGKQIFTWGKSERNGSEGFGSCCNPMNVCFGTDGEVYTAESTTGRIKCYRPDGTLLEIVGCVKLVPGCKNVAIAVNAEGDRVYMLDITRSHIVVMARKATAADETVAAVVPTTQEGVP